MKNLFSKNFTLLIIGQAASLFGNCILDFALSMYVLDLTGSAAAFAGFLMIAMIPTIILSPLGGVLADRVNRRNIMVFLDLSSGIVVLSAAFTIARGDQLVIIGTVLFILSVLGAFESPTVQACVPQMQSGSNIIRGNAVVSQINAVSTLIGPFVGSILYTVFGLELVMYVGGICFMATAALEYFIRLEHHPAQRSGTVLKTVMDDLAGSTHFICRKKPSILKLLFLVTLISFFIQGAATVGFPFLVRNVLGLNANFYGAAESILGFASIAGGILAGLMVTKFSIRKLNLPIFGLGLFLLPIGLLFLFSIHTYTRYIALVVFFSFIQISACIFSIFGLSIIQQMTPEHMIGKVMAYTVTITLCAQPLSQVIYGILFDHFSAAVYIVVLPTGFILCVIGLAVKGFFLRLAEETSIDRTPDIS